MRTPGHLVLTVTVVCFLLVISQLLLKQSLRQASSEPVRLTALLLSLVVLPAFWLAVVSTGVAALIWLCLLRTNEVSGIYPFLSLSYVLMVPAARLAFGEPLTVSKLAGTAIIVLGVFVVARSVP